MPDTKPDIPATTITAAEAESLQARLTAIEQENAVLLAGAERRRIIDEVGSLTFSEGRVKLAPAGRDALVDALAGVTDEQRTVILAAVKGLRFADLSERGFTSAEPGDGTVTAAEEADLKEMAQRNGLTFDEVKNQFVDVRKRRKAA